MPAGFTSSFAKSLDSSCPMKVKEAEDGESIEQGTCYIAPGGYHMVIAKKLNKYYISLNQEPPIKNLRPAVDKLFYAAAEKAGHDCMGVVLTGMGDDGARGAKQLKESGAYTVAQDENSSVVYGMPGQAVALGGIEDIVSLDQIPQAIIDYLKE